MIWSIAWKNIWRNKLRSLVVIMAVTIGLLAGLFVVALTFGMAEQRIDAAIRYEVSHLQLHHPEFMDNKEIKYTIPAGDSVLAVIRRIPGVKAASARSRILSMICSSTSSSGVNLTGIDPADEQKVTYIHSAIGDTCGSYFGTDKKLQLVIGEKLARKLKVRLKSKVVLKFQNSDGTLTESGFRITGLYRTNNSVFDETNVFARNTDLDAITGQGRMVHEIAVVLDKNADPLQLENLLKSRFPSLSIRSWQELQPELGMLTGFMNVTLYIIMVIILLALAFGIVNTMLMVVLERVPELGMLMAIGMSKGRIFKMIMLETVFLSLTGGILGMGLSIVCISIFRQVGIDLSAFAAGLEALGYEAVIYPDIGTGFYFGVTVLVILTGIASSLYPARKALGLKPTEALRVE